MAQLGTVDLMKNNFCSIVIQIIETKRWFFIQTEAPCTSGGIGGQI